MAPRALFFLTTKFGFSDQHRISLDHVSFVRSHRDSARALSLRETSLRRMARRPESHER